MMGYVAWAAVLVPVLLLLMLLLAAARRPSLSPFRCPPPLANDPLADAAWLAAVGTPVDVSVRPLRTGSGPLDGVRLRVWVVEGDAAAAAASPAPTEALLVHGACSEGRTWVRLLRDPWWRRAFRRILVVDLPGYGASTVASMPGRSRDVQATFAEALGQALDVVCRDGARVVVVAHSMGAVVTAPLTCPRLGERVVGFMWVCPIGALPTLGVCGAWWSLLFEYGFPHRQLHAMGPRAASLVLGLLGMRQLQGLSAPTATGFRAPQTFVGKSPLGRNFEDPWLYRACRRLQRHEGEPPPIVLLSGERDTLVPPHLVEMTRRGLLRYRPDLSAAHHLVPRAGHSLESFPGELLRAACAQLLRTISARPARPAPSPRLPRTPTSFPDVAYTTSFSRSRTRRSIASFYASLLDSGGPLLPGPEGVPEAPRVVERRGCAQATRHHPPSPALPPAEDPLRAPALRHFPHDEGQPVEVQPPQPEQHHAEGEERSAV